MEDLLDETYVVASHEDFDVWSHISVGFDDRKNFVVRMMHEDLDSHRMEGCDAVLSYSEASRLARAMRTRVSMLPEAFEREFEYMDAFVPSEVETCFQEVLEFILDNGCRYVIKDWRR